jgi:hypothetical protein
VPSAADLFSLRQLCGDEQHVTDYLAKVYACESSTLAPLVRAGYVIANLPPAVPPSRQRTAPPSMLAAETHKLPPTVPMPPPPASAPLGRAASSAELLVASVRRVDALHGGVQAAAASLRRMNAQLHTRSSSILPSLPASLPEDRAVCDIPAPTALARAPPAADVHPPGGSDDALTAFLARHAQNRNGHIAPSAGAPRGGAIPSSWMTRR